MPPPSFSMTRPKRSCDPGPSIPAAPGRCPLHRGQLGWNMLLPCEACIALAFHVPTVPSNSHAVDPPGISQEVAIAGKHVVEQHPAAPGWLHRLFWSGLRRVLMEFLLLLLLLLLLPLLLVSGIRGGKGVVSVRPL